MFGRKKKYLFKFNDAYEKEKYAVVTAKCEADAVWKFVNYCVFLRINLDCKYEMIGEVKSI